MDKWNENEQKRSVQALLLELQESEIKYSDGEFITLLQSLGFISIIICLKT